MTKPRIESIKIITKPDESPDTSYLDQEEFAERKAAFNRGEFGIVGMYAEAECSTDAGQGCRRLERLQSGGLWGIESDSGDPYFAEIAVQELSCLLDHLRDYGVSLKNFAKLAAEALKNRR